MALPSGPLFTIVHWLPRVQVSFNSNQPSFMVGPQSPWKMRMLAGLQLSGRALALYA